jgi:hypothetical protein
VGAEAEGAGLASETPLLSFLFLGGVTSASSSFTCRFAGGPSHEAAWRSSIDLGNRSKQMGHSVEDEGAVADFGEKNDIAWEWPDTGTPFDLLRGRPREEVCFLLSGFLL